MTGGSVATANHGAVQLWADRDSFVRARRTSQCRGGRSDKRIAKRVKKVSVQKMDTNDRAETIP